MSTTTSGRIHSMDGLRALAMLLILPAHALVLIGFQSGWDDFQASLFWLIHAFRLPLFFLVAGFFAALVTEARGVRGLLRNRAVRIGIPLVLATLIAVPVLTLCLRAVATVEYRAGSAGLLATFADIHPSYVWFLWYLALLYGGTLLARRALAGRTRIHDLLRGCAAPLAHWAAPVLLAVPCAVLLYRQPQWIAGTPAGSFAPELDLLAYYAIFFVCGWAIFAAPGLRDAIELRPWRYLALSALALPPSLALYLLRDEAAIGANRWLHASALLLLSISSWAIVFGLLGLARRYLAHHNPRLRYWADASYWIYLSHFPLMAALAIAILELPMPGALRAAILICVPLLIVFPAYGSFVRHSAIGRVLHGPRVRPGERRVAVTPQPRRSVA